MSKFHGERGSRIEILPVDIYRANWIFRSENSIISSLILITRVFVCLSNSLSLSCILERVGNRPRVTFNDLSCNEVCREIQERREDKRFISLRRIFLLAFVPSGISKKRKKENVRMHVRAILDIRSIRSTRREN